MGVAREAELANQREPHPQPAAKLPDEETQMKHQLTHTPYMNWCEHCISHRARPDRRIRDGSVKFGGTPTVSFDFAYTKAVEPGADPQNVNNVVALIMVDSATNYVGCVPITSKAQFDLMTREVLQFTQVLGHAECVYLADNEPSIRQFQRQAVQARLALGGKPSRRTQLHIPMGIHFVRIQLAGFVDWLVH